MEDIQIDDKRIFEILAHSGQIERYKAPVISDKLASLIAGYLIGLLFGIAVGVIFF